MENEKTLQMTITGEIFQPVRLYYQISDKRMIRNILSKLRCFTYVTSENRWLWLYEGESKHLEFERSYSVIPKKFHPIILGSIYFEKQVEMFIDLRSFERAIKAILFFDKYVTRSAARITHAAIVNRLFDVQEGLYQSLDVFFSSNKIKERDPDGFVKGMKPAREVDNINARRALSSTFLEKEAEYELPEVEKFPVHFYEDGIDTLEGVFRVRQIIASEHWKGNKSYTFLDILKEIIPKF